MLFLPGYSLTSSAIQSPLPIVETLDTPESVERYIGAEALKKEFNPVKAQSIAWAESRFKENASNTGSTASGVWQFLDGTFRDYCIKKYQLTDTMTDKNDVKIQTECALRMLVAGGEGHWSPSRPHWSDYVPTSPQLSLK